MPPSRIGGIETIRRTDSESKSSSWPAASPPPIRARAVRFQARNVRSLANVKRGSGSSPTSRSEGGAMTLIIVARRCFASRSSPPAASRCAPSASTAPCRAGRRGPPEILDVVPRAALPAARSDQRGRPQSHLLVVWSRLGAFDQAELERLVYEDRELFEYWAHEASLVLTEDLPLHRWDDAQRGRAAAACGARGCASGGTSTRSSAATCSTACAPTGRCPRASSTTTRWRRGCRAAGPTSGTSRACST